MVKVTPQQIFTTRWKIPYPHQDLPNHSSLGREIFSPTPFMLFGKPWLTFPLRGVEIISTYFSIWLWISTQFNTPKNEMSLKVLLVVGNGFLISTWKYWITKNDSILRTTAWKGCWLLFYPKSCVGCHFASFRKIPTSLLDKYKTMT